MNPQRHILIQRHKRTSHATYGTLHINENGRSIFSCKTLELPWRDNKPNESCIPKGMYVLEYEYSHAFRRKLYELKGVPGRTEVKIHPANFSRQLKGCIAPGMYFTDIDHDGINDLVNSSICVDAIHNLMKSSRSYILIEDV